MAACPCPTPHLLSPTVHQFGVFVAPRLLGHSPRGGLAPRPGARGLGGAVPLRSPALRGQCLG